MNDDSFYHFIDYINDNNEFNNDYKITSATVTISSTKTITSTTTMIPTVTTTTRFKPLNSNDVSNKRSTTFMWIQKT